MNVVKTHTRSPRRPHVKVRKERKTRERLDQLMC